MSSKFKIGDKILHKKHGVGTIVNINYPYLGGDLIEYTVHFGKAVGKVKKPNDLPPTLIYTVRGIREESIKPLTELGEALHGD